ncbi:hypothetical protein CLOP_g23484 [Closterium sp. NIES-67]|nr:hypothetical protein CLOP_g23484 [Closterium sp. NIES-67]
MLKFISKGFSGPSRQKKGGSQATDSPSGSSLVAFSYKELLAATNKFHSSRVLGEGSFGKVYRGKVSGVRAEVWQEDSNEGASKGDGSEANASNGDADKGDAGKAKASKPDKREVAIKVLHEDSIQGVTEWMAEILLLGRLRHPNLVNLIGYCSQKNQAMLVYALMPHGGLDTWLLQDSTRPVLTWQQRILIALGAARGLAYLHGANIIHRDLKSCNILLDEHMCARLTDFGMARAGPEEGNTHVSTQIKGTLGYLDPEYMDTGHLAPSSDMYSLGVILLELLTGRPPVEPDSSTFLVYQIRPYFDKREPRIDEFIDPRLEGRFGRKSAVGLAVLARHCLNDMRSKRPEADVLVERLKDLENVVMNECVGGGTG